jgi:hypothetical protein
LALDLFYYVLYAKRRNDDFELPSPFTESWETPGILESGKFAQESGKCKQLE